MSTALAFLILISPFALATLLTWAAHRSGSLRIRLDQFGVSGPMTGRLLDHRDSDSYRVQHDLDAIRTRFEEQPVWPGPAVSSERR